jgi:hypothetical protein
VCADLRDPASVLEDPGLGKVIDLGRPACLLASMVLHYSPPGRARQILAGYVSRLAAGSLVAVAVPRIPDPVAWRRLAGLYAPERPHSFTCGQFISLFAGQGLELVPPGAGTAAGLRPGWNDTPEVPRDRAVVLAAIARKP